MDKRPDGMIKVRGYMRPGEILYMTIWSIFLVYMTWIAMEIGMVR